MDERLAKMFEPPPNIQSALLDELRKAGWVLLPPDKVRELKQLIGVVLDEMLVTPTVPTKETTP
jgi:hypothetical protein